METSNRGFRDPLDGIALFNTSGGYIVKWVNDIGTR